ncbi:MAG: ABC transporter substrate-binding protein [Nitrospiraceae bacterium]|nr:ABC transporter substrate-binding protein [Nitrospiraceae bacterium]
MSPTVPAKALRSPRVVSPWRPGLGSLAWSALRPGGLLATWRRTWIAKSTAFALPLFLVALTYTIAFVSSGQILEPPTEAVRSTLTEVFRILEDEKLKDPAKLIPRRHMLEEVIASHFDYTEMSKRALASHWVPLTTGERAEFVELFKGFLSDRYAEKIEGYSGQQVLYLSERIEGNYAEVRTELRSSKVEIPMDYRLFSKEGRWQAYDIIVDGVSLVKNYRSQFEKVIRSSSYQELVRWLRERTVVEDKKKKAAVETVSHSLAA